MSTHLEIHRVHTRPMERSTLHDLMREAARDARPTVPIPRSTLIALLLEDQVAMSDVEDEKSGPVTVAATTVRVECGWRGGSGTTSTMPVTAWGERARFVVGVVLAIFFLMASLGW